MSELTIYRKFLLTALTKVDEGFHLNTALKDAPSQDRNLCHEILYGVIRWRGSIDKIIRSRVQKNPKKGVRRILSLAIYELIWMKRPAHVVVDQTVKLCKSTKFKRQANFINAVLRNIPDNIDSLLELDDNFPTWLLELWGESKLWKESLQSQPRFAMAFKEEPSSDYPEMDTVTDLNTERLYWSPFRGSISSWQGFDSGDWWITNPAAAYVVDRSIKASKLTIGGKILDLCSAPGGKTMRFISQGFTVTSVDSSQQRMDRLRENLERVNLQCTSQVLDCLEDHPELGKYQLVFLDAPCSGLGVIRKHPEIRWNRTESDIIANSIIQLRLLQKAVQYVDVNGVLAYCVCSLHPFEGEGVVNQFCKLNPDWSIIDTWKTPIDSETLIEEPLDGFQLFLLKVTEDIK